MPSLEATRASNEVYSPSYVPVIVVYGGTAGIGEATAKALSRYTKGRARLIIVGRNQAAGNAIIESLPTPGHSDSKGLLSSVRIESLHGYEIISCDLNLKRNVDSLNKDLTARLPKINYLILSAGVVGIGGRDETDEGLDRKLASRYYSRFAIIHGLLPLLRKADELGEDANVLSIMGAGLNVEVALRRVILAEGDDTEYWVQRSYVRGFLKPRIWHCFHAYSPRKRRYSQVPKHSGEIHLRFHPSWSSYVNYDPGNCAECMIYALLNGKKGRMYRRGWNGGDIGLAGFPAASVGLSIRSV